MHYWRLLLFALLAVFQPIASFTERNLVDGREQCCGRDSLLRDARLSYETHTNKPSEDRRLSRDVREDRRYEVRRTSPGLTQASADRHLVEFRSERDVRRFSPETLTRPIRAESRREYVTDYRRERFSTLRDDRARRISYQGDKRDLRERDVIHRIYPRDDIRQQHRAAREPSRTRQNRDSRITRNLDTERSSRTSLESRRETRWNRNNPEERRVRTSGEERAVLQRTRADVANHEQSRAREDRRVIRERTDERRARSESRLRVNREQNALNRRVRETVDGSRTRSLDNVRDERLDSRYARGERRFTSHREVQERLEKRTLHRDEHRASRDMFVRRELKERMSEERREIRDSDRSRVEIRNIGQERADTRRDSKYDERLVNRAYFDTHRVETPRVRDAVARNRVTERRDQRSTDRFDDIRDSRRDVQLIRSRSLEPRERGVSNNREEYRLVKHMERDVRFRTNPEFFKSREASASLREKNTNEQSSATNWQYVFYTLQGIYLCGVLMQMLSQKESSKKPRALSWLTAPQNLMKVD